MRASSLVLVALALCAALAVQAQAPIPYRPDGWQIGGPLTAPIVMDVFVDVLCPDCAGAWPTVKQLIGYYGQKLAVSLHTFPLPYHTYGFVAAQAAHVAVNNGAQPVAVADFIFNAQSAYWNDAVANKTSTEVQAALGAQLVAGKLVSASAFAAGMSDANINNEVRVSWKYACSRGVLGTPTFFINGVTLAADPSWSFSDWRSVLDPLLAPQPTHKQAEAPIAVTPERKHRSVHRHAAAASAAPHSSGCIQRSAASRRFVSLAQTCPAGEPTCTYLPGKTECCFKGEACIPNVGCRC